jgi:DNA-binding PadR family transcriptional regulator
MTIHYAILGLLSWKSFSGYELKKLFSNSSLFYWSGNNNQIYVTLLNLSKEKLVTQEVQQQENLPAKKIYSITRKGLTELKKWMLSNQELPEIRNAFLMQLAGAYLLSDEELMDLINRYEEELYVALLMEREKAKRNLDHPSRTKRETFLWGMINKNFESFYENEIKWLTLVKKGLPHE